MFVLRKAAKDKSDSCFNCPVMKIKKENLKKNIWIRIHNKRSNIRLKPEVGGIY